jgi:hypothetical protein
MKTLLALLFRLILLAALTFGFVVLYEYGPSGFLKGAPIEFERMGAFLRSLRGDESDTPSPGGYREPDLPTEDGIQPNPIAPEAG